LENKYKLVPGRGWVEKEEDIIEYIQEKYNKEDADDILNKRITIYSGYPDITVRALIANTSKKVTRALIQLMEKPFIEMPLYIGHRNMNVREIAKWRLRIGK